MTDPRTPRIEHAPLRELTDDELIEAHRCGHLSRALLEAEKHRRFAQRLTTSRPVAIEARS